MTNLEKLNRAILSLRPGAQFSLQGETYDNLVWLDTALARPTRAEVNAEIARLDQLDTQESSRIIDIRNDATRSDMLAQLRAATPTQISNWVDNQINGTTVTAVRDQCRVVFKRILLAISLDNRS
jgi:hypothetical protein